jgi:septal ring factor EnvC (AmiA/AmiB activator)
VKLGWLLRRSGCVGVRVVLTCLILLGGSSLPDVQAAKRDSATTKESELKQVRERIESVRKAIQADAERRESLVGELKHADETIQSARVELADVHTRRVAAEQQLTQLEQERRDTQQRIDDERDALASELRLAYMNGRGEQFKLLLNQEDPARLGRMLSYYGYFGRARAEHIGLINDQLAHLALLTERITEQTQRLRDIENDNERSVKALANARERRVGTLKNVESKLKDRNEQLAKLQSDAKALERLIDELRAAMARAAEQARQNKSGTKPLPAPTGRGRWPWPVSGEVLARFGQLRAGGPLKWEGLMIGASQGSPVRAPAAGRVLFSDWLPGLGLLLVLDHGGGIMSLYGHNEQLYKKVGEQVNAGDVLSAVGDSGLEGRSGVYLEIRNGKQPVDPLNWLGKP